MDLGMEINIQHLFKVVLEKSKELRRHYKDPQTLSPNFYTVT